MAGGTTMMNAQPSHVVTASELARTLGVSELELHRLAYERRLPFFHGATCGWGISRSDLNIWKTAALLAANERENAA
jgi:hypothetical protein